MGDCNSFSNHNMCVRRSKKQITNIFFQLNVEIYIDKYIVKTEQKVQTRHKLKVNDKTNKRLKKMKYK